MLKLCVCLALVAAASAGYDSKLIESAKSFLLNVQS